MAGRAPTYYGKRSAKGQTLDNAKRRGHLDGLFDHGVRRGRPDGCFAAYAAQIPFDRALTGSATLGHVLAIGDVPARLEPLRPALGDRAEHVVVGPCGAGGGGGVAHVRGVRAESANVGFRLRIVIAAFTAAGAPFGAAVLSIVRRAPAQ